MPYKNPETRKEHSRLYYELNKERLAAYKKMHASPYNEKRIEYMRKWYSRNKKIMDARSLAWARAHPERHRSFVRAWRERNLDRIKSYTKAYRDKNKGTIDARQRIYRKLHIDKCRKHWKTRADKIKNSPVLLEQRRRQQLEYYQRNKTKRIASASFYAAVRRARLAGAKGTFTELQWLARLEYYGCRCAYCHVELDRNSATIDHAIPISRGGTNWPSNLVPACLRCNIRKGNRTWKISESG